MLNRFSFALAIAATMPAVCSAQCPPTAYSVRLAQLSGAITVTVPAGLRNLDPVAMDVGGEFRRGMLASMAPTVVSDVLTSYACIIEREVNGDATKSAEEKVRLLEAWSDIQVLLEDKAVTYYSAFLQSIGNGLAASPLMEKVPLTASEQALKPYIAKLPQDNFTVYYAADLWSKAIYKGIAVGACGGFVREALSDNASSTQQLANSIRPALVKYVGSVNNGSRDAKHNMWAQAATLPYIGLATEKTKRALDACKKEQPVASPVTNASAASAPPVATAPALPASAASAPLAEPGASQ